MVDEAVRNLYAVFGDMQYYKQQFSNLISTLANKYQALVALIAKKPKCQIIHETRLIAVICGG